MADVLTKVIFYFTSAFFFNCRSISVLCSDHFGQVHCWMRCITRSVWHWIHNIEIRLLFWMTSTSFDLHSTNSPTKGFLAAKKQLMITRALIRTRCNSTIDTIKAMLTLKWEMLFLKKKWCRTFAVKNSFIFMDLPRYCILDNLVSCSAMWLRTLCKFIGKGIPPFGKIGVTK